MKYIIIIIGFISILFYSCEDESDIVYPDPDADEILEHTTPLGTNSKLVLEGIYEIIEGQEEFGEYLVLKWNQDFLLAFFSKNAGYIALQGGRIDSVILLKGYWRHLVNTNIGIVNFIIERDSGFTNIINGDTTNLNISISGKYGKGKSIPDHSLKLKYLRPIKDSIRNSEFYILGHRGGARNAEQLGVSENSIEMIRKSVELGVNGIELDIRTSEDNVPFCYHDDDVNLRVTQPSLLVGKIENFTFPQLRSYLKLPNGEKIPSMREALDEVLKQGHIGLVWLDLKSEKNDVQLIRDLQLEYEQKALSMGRVLKIYLGIPIDEKYQQIKQLPDVSNIKTINELDLSKVREINSEIWGARWTEGLQEVQVDEMHAEGRKVFSWTLDEPLFIQKYVNDGNFDGILSNYPPLIAYYHYIK